MIKRTSSSTEMVDALSTTRPAWQTDELEEEWIEEATDDHQGSYQHDIRSVSLTAPLPTEIRTSLIERDATTASPSDMASQPAGTFLIRDEVPETPLFPKSPGRNKKGRIKDFFSPLPLERMFEPPSPPQPPQSIERRASRFAESYRQDANLQQQPEHQRTQNPDKTAAKVDSVPPSGPSGTSLECKFTFSVPWLRSQETFPQAQSTPGPPIISPAKANNAPGTDPRLRLFQFQYDTFTREHLSAIVDSIAVNTPSGDSATDNQSLIKGNHGLSPVSESNSPSISDLRSAKRVKLSPQTDLYGEGDGAGAVISRPKNPRKDYIGESRSLMQQIRQARDFSTISTSTSVHAAPSMESHHDEQKKGFDAPRATLAVPETARFPSSSTTKSVQHSSSSYRKQAASLMAQIKNDMQGSKRLFSGETDVSQLTFVSGKTKPSSDDPYALQISTWSEDKENDRDNSLRHASRRSTRHNLASIPAKVRNSKKTTHFSTVSNDGSRKLVDGVSKLSVDDIPDNRPPVMETRTTLRRPSAQLAPPPRLAHSCPSSTTRVSTNEDLNRFVSSSTASGTTLTAGSGGSLAKHPGPAQIRRIAPEDVPTLPDRVGKMVLDKVMMRWVKDTAVAVAGLEPPDLGDGTDGESEDPFKDIESLREDDSAQEADNHDDVMSRIEEVEEEHNLNSFSFDDSSAAVVSVMTGVETAEIDDGDQTTDSEDLVVAEEDLEPHQGDSFYSEDESQVDHYVLAYGAVAPTPLQEEKVIPVPQRAVVFSTPLQLPRGQTPGTTPVVRSALKSSTTTPVSALKDPNRQRTPVSRSGHSRRRSVSFSDGKREGPIRGLGRDTDCEDVGQHGEGGSFIPSARSKRIAALIDDLDDSDFDENESPSKTSGTVNGDLQSLTMQNLSVSANATAGSSLQAGSSGGSPKLRSSSSLGARKRGCGKDGRISANATFLTDCSFAVAQDKLVQVITDIVPFEPHWEDLSCIDLSNRKLESVARLKEFLPRLDSLQLDSNELSWLSGVPQSVRTLSAPRNHLSSMTSYNHLRNIESLDISQNDIDSLCQLECLRHLRELKADGNRIDNFDGLQKMERLEKLSVEGNCIRSADMRWFRWNRLEMLNMCKNGLQDICGLASLGSLMSLNLDHNALREIGAGGIMPKLRILRASNNLLQELDAGEFPNLRTLYLDNNALRFVNNVERLPKLENLSLRNQSGRELNFLTRDTREVKRLYLSGNPLKKGFLDGSCYQLVYLELAACRLRRLPDGLAQLVPNLRVLNLNYNFLEDARELAGLVRLRKLTMIGSRLKDTKGLIRLLQGMPELEMLDCRMNPCTLGWYLPLLVKDAAGALEPCGRGWSELDRQFRRDLPDDVYVGRLAYRGLVMRACKRIRMLDGVEVAEKERVKAEQVIRGLLLYK